MVRQIFRAKLMEHDPVSESILQSALCGQLESGKDDEEVLRRLVFRSCSSPGIRTLGDLINSPDYAVFEETSEWRNNKHFGEALADVAEGCIPDIVVRSTRSNDNRIFFEVKKSAAIREYSNGHFDSQVVRYFLLLLATTLQNSTLVRAKGEFRRALILAAPAEWFATAHVERWDHFVATFAGLAAAFDVTLATLEVQVCEFAVKD